MSDDTLQRIRHALGRSEPLAAPPRPPHIPEPVVRLVHSDIGLPELFARRAAANNMTVELVHPEEVGARVVAFLQARGLRQIGLPVSPFLERLGIIDALRQAGLELHSWDQLTLDATFDLQASVSDVTYAVAETGSLVVRPSAQSGRALSLMPPVYIAIVEPKNCVGDLLDLMERIQRDGIPTNITLITGPSKTADIEGALVVGVHGPGTVQIFVLQ